MCHRFLSHCFSLGRVLERFRGILERFGGVLGRPGASWSRLGSVLEASWRCLRRSEPFRTANNGPSRAAREGVGGG